MQFRNFSGSDGGGGEKDDDDDVEMYTNLAVVHSSRCTFETAYVCVCL